MSVSKIFKIICAAKKACDELIVNITSETKIAKVSIICTAKFACDEAQIIIDAFPNNNIEFSLECQAFKSCQMTQIQFNNVNSAIISANILCYDNFACDDLFIDTDHSPNIFISLSVYRYSKKIEINYYHWQNINVKCAVTDDSRFIRYDNNELLDVEEVLQSARKEYKETHRLPCEDVNIYCSNNTDFERQCVFEYGLSNNFSLFDLLNDKAKPKCYWLDIERLYTANCKGTCGDVITYYEHNQTFDIDMIFYNSDRRRLLNGTESYRVCDEYFGSENDTLSSLSSIDAIFEAVLNLIASVSDATVHNILRNQI